MNTDKGMMNINRSLDLPLQLRGIISGYAESRLQCARAMNVPIHSSFGELIFPRRF